MPDVSPILPVTLWAVASLVPWRRPGPAGFVILVLSLFADGLTFVALAWVLAWMAVPLAQGRLSSLGGAAYLILAAGTVVMLVEVLRRAALARPAVDAALTAALGTGNGLRRRSGRATRRRIAELLLAPIPLPRPSVRRVRNIRYGDAGRRNLLDLYQPRHPRPGSAPVLIHLHGGGFHSGNKSRESMPLLYRFAGNGWTCLSASYRLRDAGRYPDAVIDVKKVIAWVHAHALEYNLDPSRIVVAGSSAGAYLAAMAALTCNEPRFQPGFETNDTTVAAAVCLYGYYGDTDDAAPGPNAPLGCVRSDAPPFLIAHGDHDTLVPISAARRVADRISSTSAQPVVWVRLPGAQHSFDLFNSLRFTAVIDGIEAFTAPLRNPAPQRQRNGPIVAGHDHDSRSNRRR